MTKKYKLDENDTITDGGQTLYRIIALIAIGTNVSVGDKGGYIETEKNLSHAGNAWVSGNARVSGDADYFCAQSFGSYGRTTTFFREKSGWRVKCGCFDGTVEEFRAKVKQTHGDSLIAQEYLLIANLMDIRIKRQEAQNEAK